MKKFSFMVYGTLGSIIKKNEYEYNRRDSGRIFQINNIEIALGMNTSIQIKNQL
jgi:hypothetical protein